jgi:hypothetical protein
MTQSITLITQEGNWQRSSCQAARDVLHSVPCGLNTDFSEQQNRGTHRLAHSHIRNDWVFGLCPSPEILKNIHEYNKVQNPRKS